MLWNNFKELKGLHTVAGVYRKGKFIVYNALGNSDEVLELDPLKKLAKRSQMIGVYLFD